MTLILYDMENIKSPVGENKSKTSFRFDLIKLSKELESYSKDIIKQAAFIAIPRSHKGKNTFLEFLKNNKITPVIKNTLVKSKILPDGSTYSYNDNDIDIKVALYALNFYQSFDHIILVSGDGDMVELVKKMQNDNKYVTVVSWKDTMSNYLKETANHYLYLNDLNIKKEA